MSSKEKVLKVQYTYVDGMHFFVSGDALTKGLCAGHTNLKVAYDEVAIQLNYLFKKNCNIDVMCVPEGTFDEFKKWLKATLDTTKDVSIEPVPNALIGWAQSEVA